MLSFPMGQRLGGMLTCVDSGVTVACTPPSLKHTIQAALHNGEHIIYLVVQAQLL